MFKKIKTFCSSLTIVHFDQQHGRQVRNLRPEITTLITLLLLLFAIIVGIIDYTIDPNPAVQTSAATHTPRQQNHGSRYEDFLLPFFDERQSDSCLQWLNTAPASQILPALSREKLNSGRIEILLAHRPYKSWVQVNALPKIGNRTLQQIIKAWSRFKVDENKSR